VVFAAGSFITQSRNYKNIIAPIISLKKQTEGIRHGDIDTAVTTNGFGELGELAGAVENLRVELKNSVYYRQKVDENRKFLISSISHDLKTPVTSIRGYIDGVLDGVANTDEKKEEYLKKAIVKIAHMNTMIDDLLLYSKLDLNQMPFDTRRISISCYISNLTNEYAADFEREGKTLFFEDNMKKEVYVKIDAEKMKRAVQNIFDNAKKNIETGNGRLEITIRESAAAVLIEFRDNGKGIIAKDMPHLFERFYRGDEARTADGSGGLGLAIAKQMIHGMDGRIWAVSKANEGASFIISLKKYKGL
jgi:signal transduction histidine kinase